MILPYKLYMHDYISHLQKCEIHARCEQAATFWIPATREVHSVNLGQSIILLSLTLFYIHEDWKEYKDGIAKCFMRAIANDEKIEYLVNDCVLFRLPNMR